MINYFIFIYSLFILPRTFYIIFSKFLFMMTINYIINKIFFIFSRIDDYHMLFLLQQCSLNQNIKKQYGNLNTVLPPSPSPTHKPVRIQLQILLSLKCVIYRLQLIFVSIYYNNYFKSSPLTRKYSIYYISIIFILTHRSYKFHQFTR